MLACRWTAPSFCWMLGPLLTWSVTGILAHASWCSGFLCPLMTMPLPTPAQLARPHLHDWLDPTNLNSQTPATLPTISSWQFKGCSIRMLQKMRHQSMPINALSRGVVTHRLVGISWVYYCVDPARNPEIVPLHQHASSWGKHASAESVSKPSRRQHVTFATFLQCVTKTSSQALSLIQLHTHERWERHQYARALPTHPLPQPMCACAILVSLTGVAHLACDMDRLALLPVTIVYWTRWWIATTQWVCMCIHRFANP